MKLLKLNNSRTGATGQISPQAGFNLFQLRLPVGEQLVDVLDAAPDFRETGIHPGRSGIPLLFPFPNRIRGGRFTWNKVDYTLDGIHQDGKGNAIHGLVMDRPWRVIQVHENAAVGQFQLSIDAPDRRSLWPADFLIEVRYELRDEGLHADVRVFNPDSNPLPFGFGTHTYFRVPLSPESRVADCLMQAPAAEQWELVDCLPTGRKMPVSGRTDLREGQELARLKLDDALTGLVEEGDRIDTVVMDPSAGLEIRQSFDLAFQHVIAFTPPHGRSVCLEPYTCITDAINLAQQGIDGGLRILGPGAEFRTWFQISASLVYA